MLVSLMVKNVALVPEATIEFGPGLNVLTGETGAGKSVVLGALSLALGQKANVDYIGRFGDSAYVEATFSVPKDHAELWAIIEEMNLEDCNGEIVISRKLMPGKNILKVNGETFTIGNVRRLSEKLLDIHGQHDHQSLLHKSVHLDILDRFAKASLKEVKAELRDAYNEYRKAQKALMEFDLNEEEQRRNISFLTFEIEEIEKAGFQPGEDEQLEMKYRKMTNAKRITEEVGVAYELLSTGEVSASELIGRAYSSLSSCSHYDDTLSPMLEELSNIESLLSDLNHELSDYLSDLEFDDETFYSVENRLNELNHLKSKYGNSHDAVMAYLAQSQEKLSFYEDYANRKETAEKSLSLQEQKVKALCAKLTQLRKETIPGLVSDITKALTDLNFGQVCFDMQLSELKEPTMNGWDELEFMISLNPGEELRPLSKIASGGEMSRIMLGIKSVLAGKDDIPTLIFDEIDTGISGRTAQMVSEKMACLASNHQLICITHLPQIAAMADTHFLISKSVSNQVTTTQVEALEEKQMVEELGRMLGGMEITTEVLLNAEQMKNFASDYKRNV